MAKDNLLGRRRHQLLKRAGTGFRILTTWWTTGCSSPASAAQVKSWIARPSRLISPVAGRMILNRAEVKTKTPTLNCLGHEAARFTGAKPSSVRF